MTGTAATEVAEFSNIYELDVTIVPTNKARPGLSPSPVPKPSRWKRRGRPHPRALAPGGAPEGALGAVQSGL